MKGLSVFLLLIPILTFAQKGNVINLDTVLKGKDVHLFNWKYKLGDSLDWAKADFDDTSWETAISTNDLANTPEIAKNRKIIWLRKRLSTGSTLDKQVILRVFQSGASEVYLDGKLLHQLGVVSTNPDSVKSYDPVFRLLSLPLSFNKEQVLAIRFASKPMIYPIYSPQKSWINIWVSKLEDISDGFIFNYLVKSSARISVVIGVFSILFILFFSFFIFNPSEKINLYFSIYTLCSLLSDFIDYKSDSDSGYRDLDYRYLSLPVIFRIISWLFGLYYVYYICKIKIDKLFFSIVVLGIILMPIDILISSFILGIFGLFINIVALFIAIKGFKNKIEGFPIFFVGLFLVSIHYILSFLSDNNILVTPILSYRMPYGGLILPVTIAIYLGYLFNLSNQKLRLKLAEVQHLTTEKHRIATDMHDDIGSDLSALNIKTERIRQKVKAGQLPIAELDNLIDASRTVTKKVREVIWTINARHDSLESIVNYFDVYAEGFFEPTNVVVSTILPLVIPYVVINGESRKVLLMCFKETLNNVLKHAKASDLKIAFLTEHHALTISIQDNGVGFDTSALTASTTNGNGLANLQERMAGIGGKCVIQTSGKGTLVVLSFPL